MPLVTRTAVSGNVYRQATQPTDWINGDLWVDTDNGLLYVNINGTATAIVPTQTASRAIVSDAGGALASSTTTSTQIGYLSTSTSDLQVQVDSKIGSSSNVAVNGVTKTLTAWIQGAI